MNQVGINSAVAARRASAVTSIASRPAPCEGSEDLELKLASLQRDYADLHTAIFEPALQCGDTLIREDRHASLPGRTAA